MLLSRSRLGTIDIKKKNTMKEKNDYTNGKKFPIWLITETPVAFIMLTLMMLLGGWYWLVDNDKTPIIVVSLFYAGYLGAAWNNWKDLKRGIRK